MICDYLGMSGVFAFLAEIQFFCISVFPNDTFSGHEAECHTAVPLAPHTGANHGLLLVTNLRRPSILVLTPPYLHAVHDSFSKLET